MSTTNSLASQSTTLEGTWQLVEKRSEGLKGVQKIALSECENQQQLIFTKNERWMMQTISYTGDHCTVRRESAQKTVDLEEGNMIYFDNDIKKVEKYSIDNEGHLVITRHQIMKGRPTMLQWVYQKN